ncbi:MAG: (deoxy)nucleoside triphosphate pyrophosphohydrolase [bacterium]|nr:(deoxy)nucleoside triphosphate pyrophosphohydrolase [bacterium]
MSAQYIPDARYIDVAAALIIENDTILVGKRSLSEKYAGKWEFPGGKVEQRETPEICLKREIQEELNCDIEIGELFLVSVHDFGREDKKKYRFFSFLCSGMKGDVVLAAHDEIVWTPFERLLDFEFIDADKIIARKILAALGKK